MLWGRTKELDRIRSFLARAARQGEALVLSGEAGVGKTVLLEAAVREASAAGVRVLRVSGVEFGLDVSFSVVGELIHPLADTLHLLGDTHRNALDVALGRRQGPIPERLVIPNAVLLLLRRAALSEPLLLVVDDIPWIDRVSASVLAFVARRLSGSRVGFLAASRSGEDGFFERGDLPEHQVLPLDEEAADGLVRDRFPELAARVRERLVVTAQGNPLALLELPTALNCPQRKALEELPAVLPLSRRLQELYVSRITGLPAATQRLLLLAALDDSGDMSVLGAGARHMGSPVGLEGLALAERAKLVQIDAGSRRLAFVHPLIRSAIVETATGDERRSAHRTLAEVLADQPERQAQHLGEASHHPDEQVAAVLEQVAHRVLKRGDAVGGVAALIRAADLSPAGPSRGRRLAEAAYIGAFVTGDLQNASELLAHARLAEPDATGSLHAAMAAVHLLINGEADIDTAYRLLVGVIEEGAHGYRSSDQALVGALHTVVLLAWLGGRRELWDPFYAAVARMRPTVPRCLAIAGADFFDTARPGSTVLQQLESAIADLRYEADPAIVVRIGGMALHADRLSDLREATWRVVQHGREGGPVGPHIGGLIHLCLDDFQTGRWDEAARLADEGLGLCEEFGYRYFAWCFHYTLALIAGAKGDTATARARTDQITQWAVPRGAHGLVAVAGHVRTLTALGSGDFEAAYLSASSVGPAGDIASHNPQVLRTALDLVEAAVRTGRRAEAEAHLRAMQTASISALSPRFALLVGACTAICTEDDAAAIRVFEEALATPGLDRWPFDLARVRLIHGERLRRIRPVESRVPLDAAREGFERLGAEPWTGRATRELRATGWRPPQGSGQVRLPLTPQEREIATLAASGLTNRQIAERLFVSHRTVGSHLYQIFPKLGISSRAALRDALTAQD